MRWNPIPIYEGQEVFILGGGPSLSEFPLSFLEGSNVIGCNDAYSLPSKIVDILIFGDRKWYIKHKEKLQKFQKPIITNSPHLSEEEGIYFMDRIQEGFHKEALGWNGNTGSVAINFALISGASKIYLIGFDMQLDQNGDSNWHENDLNSPEEDHYRRYSRRIENSIEDWKSKFPGQKIININDNTALDCFPVVSLDQFIGEI